jgi:hypothetical protein
MSGYRMSGSAIAVSYLYLIVIFILFYLFICISFLPSLGLGPFCRSLTVSHRIRIRHAYSTLFPAAAVGLSSCLYSPTLAFRLSRTLNLNKLCR